MAIVDVILPIKDRDTVVVVVSTLIREIRVLDGVALGQIILCDGGSVEAVCLQQLETVSRWDDVRVLDCSYSDISEQAFNKGRLINEGLLEATAEVVLISDVDILWTADVLQAIALAAANHAERIYSVLKVKESKTDAVAARRQRYTYQIEKSETGIRVEVCAAAVCEAGRPGCGIVCAQRQVFERVGGYKGCFVGWGWEDQDFLIRAQLFGYEVLALGEVVHLSHGDERRGMIGESVEVSRDRNIVRCLTELKNQQLLGDLSEYSLAAGGSVLGGRQISVQYPPELGI